MGNVDKSISSVIWFFCFFLSRFALTQSFGLSTHDYWDQQLGFKLFLLPQANGHACVDFGCTHPIDGLFWNLSIYLLGNMNVG
jgi:hypothetical protein